MARLLSVDDDPSILRIIGRIGTELGFNVECLSSSQRFMTTYVRVKPHVVTLDIMMPDIDGIELIRWLDDIESNASIIIISGGHSYYVQATAKLAEARGRLRTSILRKPFETSLLRNALLEAAQAARVPLSPMHQ